MSESWILYVIRLLGVQDSDAKWYVGITKDFQRRMRDHRRGDGANWTRRKEILDTYEVFSHPNKDIVRALEDNLTRILVMEFGVETTRGGNFLRVCRTEYHDEDEHLLHPHIAERIREIDDRELHRILDYRGYRVQVHSPVVLPTKKAAIYWAEDALPEGASYSIEHPEDIGTSHYTGEHYLDVAEPQEYIYTESSK